MRKNKISLYIPVFNEEGRIGTLLDSIFSQSLIPDEIIIVDDGSSDNSLKIVSKYPSVRTIKHPSNKGVAAARNTGVLSSAHSLVIGVNADCRIPNSTFVEDLVGSFLSIRDKNKKFVGLGPAVKLADNNNIADQWRSVHLLGNWGKKFVLNPPYLSARAIIFSKEAILRVGLYDERYNKAGEDADICRKLLSAGYSYGYDPNIIVYYHNEFHSISGVLKSQYLYRSEARRTGVWGKVPLVGRLLADIYYSLKIIVQDMLHLRINLIFISSLVVPSNVFYDLKGTGGQQLGGSGI